MQVIIAFVLKYKLGRCSLLFTLFFSVTGICSTTKDLRTWECKRLHEMLVLENLNRITPQDIISIKKVFNGDTALFKKNKEKYFIPNTIRSIDWDDIRNYTNLTLNDINSIRSKRCFLYPWTFLAFLRSQKFQHDPLRKSIFSSIRKRSYNLPIQDLTDNELISFIFSRNSSNKSHQHKHSTKS